MKDQLKEKYPFIKCNIECNDGWLFHLEEMCHLLSYHIENNKEFEIVQIKEKFGTLRVYGINSSERIDAIIGVYEYQSGRICENCGAPGTARVNGWVKTLCDKCHKEE